jgi:hypothetical protein
MSLKNHHLDFLIFGHHNIFHILAIAASTMQPIENLLLSHSIERHSPSIRNIIRWADLAENSIHGHDREGADKISDIVELCSRSQWGSHTLNAQRAEESRERHKDAANIRHVCSPVPAMEIVLNL